MNSSSRDTLKAQLLGRSTCFPPQDLVNDATFKTNESYLEFLKESLANPETHWMQMSQYLRWDTKPQSVGKAGSWFPEGLFNISKNCIDSNIKEKGHEEPLLFELDTASNEIVSSTASDLYNIVSSIGAHMAKWKLEPGSRVLVALPSGRKMIASVLACLRSGFTVVPIDPTYSEERIVERTLKAKCKGIICNKAVFNVLDQSDTISAPVLSRVAFPDEPLKTGEEPPPALFVDAMHPAFILADSQHQLYTLPSAGFMVQAISAYKYLLSGSENNDILWTISPSHHASTLAALFGALATGCPVGTLPIRLTEDVHAFVDTIAKTKAHVLFADVKTVLEAINRAHDDDFRPAISGPSIFIIEGETLSPRIWKFIQNSLFDGKTHIVQVLSRPESGGFLSGPNPRVTPVRISSIGLPAPGMNLSISEMASGESPIGEGGLLALLSPGPGLAIELQSLPTPLSLPVKARKDAQGYFWFMGEAKVERSRVERTTLADLEATIASVEEVSQVAVIRYNDESNCPKSRAFVKLDNTAFESAKEKIHRQIISRYGVSALPDSIQFVSSLPFSRSGKLLRSVLRRISNGDPLCQEDLHLISDPFAAEEYLQASIGTKE